MGNFTGIVLLAYAAAGYWAANRVLFAKHILIGGLKDVFYTKLFIAIILGWILIPVALIQLLRNKGKN